MRASPPGELKTTDARKTYRYLRIGMIVAVVVLAVSIAIEYTKVKTPCLQTSISAYYYTPVRAIFVGGMIAVGFSLIVIKGRTTWEDISLNVAGMLAPVVAIAPTTDLGKCWSVAPIPRPIEPDGSLAKWVETNANNNFYALLIAGGLALVLAFLLTVAVNRSVRAPIQKVEFGTRVSLAVTAAALLFGWWLIENWGDFYTSAHGWSAVLMFVALISAVTSKGFEHRTKSTAYLPIYLTVAGLMAVGGVVIQLFDLGSRHTTFVLEAYEIVLFAVFWIVQTVENWDEELVPAPTGA